MGIPPYYNPDDDPQSRTYTGWGKGPRVRLLAILVLVAVVLYVFTQGGQGTDWIDVVILCGLFFGVIYSMFVADELDRAASSVAAGDWPGWKRALRAARPRFARASLYIVGGIAGVALAIWFFGTPG
jgi:hypothetical protein